MRLTMIIWLWNFMSPYQIVPLIKHKLNHWLGLTMKILY